MNEKWQITKKELKTRAQDVAGGYFNDHMMQAAVATARALGYEVVEEPELPERLQLGAWFDDGVDGRALRDAATQPNDDPGQWAIARNDRMAAEMVLRYNAKAAVLEVAGELDRLGREDNEAQYCSAERLRSRAGRLRAVYEAGDE